MYNARLEPQLYLGVEAMKVKWLKYYKDIPPIALVAFTLDPRHKIEGLEAYLDGYYKFLGFNPEPYDINNQLEVSWHRFDDETDPTGMGMVDIQSIIVDVRTQIKELYDHYSSLYSHLVRSQGSQSEADASGSGAGGSSQLSFRQRIASKRPRGSSYTEIDLYMNTQYFFSEEDRADLSFDILNWWRLNGKVYPILSLIVRDIFSSPMSTVACEQLFSKSGHMLDTTRSLVSVENVEAQVCIDDWKLAKNRNQEREVTSPEASDFFFTDNLGSTTAPSASDREAVNVNDDDNDE